MYLVLLLLFLLVGWLVALRAPKQLGVPWPEASFSTRAPARTWALTCFLAFLAQWPLLLHLPLFLREDAVLGGDAASHAAVIQELARRGAPHGWIDAYDGGFPLGVNYPPWSDYFDEPHATASRDLKKVVVNGSFGTSKNIDVYQINVPVLP